jgi:putative flippase GtrA
MSVSTSNRIAIAIPAYEPSGALIQVVQECSQAGFSEIIVVDDGSGFDYQKIFESCSKVRGVTVLRQDSNLGKGAALKRAFRFILDSKSAFDGIITADADGQHLTKDILKVRNAMVRINQSKGMDNDIVFFGSRNFSGKSIPPRSRIGNRATTRLVSLLYGHNIRDTQTGLRGIPTRQLDALVKVKGDRFEYEMNVLLDLLNRKIPIQELEIETIYHDIQNTQSHFRPIRDSLQVWFQILRFTLASLAGAAVDISVYALIIDIAFASQATAFQIAFAVVAARVCSGFTNYFLNKKLVFADENKVRVSLLRYVILALALVTASAFGTVILNELLDGHAVIAKVVADVSLYVVSFIVQKRLVFTRDTSLESRGSQS